MGFISLVGIDSYRTTEISLSHSPDVTSAWRFANSIKRSRKILILTSEMACRVVCRISKVWDQQLSGRKLICWILLIKILQYRTYRSLKKSRAFVYSDKHAKVLLAGNWSGSWLLTRRGPLCKSAKWGCFRDIDNERAFIDSLEPPISPP